MNRIDDRARCGALRKDGRTCTALSEPGKTRCRFHGGASTGPRTPTGQARARANLKQNRQRNANAEPATEHPPQVIDPAGPSAPPTPAVTATSTARGTQAMTSKTDNETAAHIEHRLAALDNELDAALQALDEAQEAFGDAALAADQDTTEQAAGIVRERQRDVERLQASREALQRRLVAAREREALEAWEARWAAFAEALEHRNVIFAKAEKLAAPFFAAVSEAVDAATAAEHLAPLREKVLTPNGWALMPDFFKSMGEMHRDDMPSVKTALRDMAARSRTCGDLALSLREYDKPGAERITEVTDPRAKAPTIEPTPILEL